MSDLDNFRRIEDDRKRVNNELVCPAFWRFCRDNDIKLHSLMVNIWKEIPKSEQSAGKIHDEMDLYREAMNCFNNLKPRFTVFENKVYTYRFTDWGGDFEYDSWSFEEFFDTIYSQINQSKLWEKQCKLAVDILTVVPALPIIALCIFLDVKFIHIPIAWMSIAVGIGLSVLVGKMIKSRLLTEPLKRVEDERVDYQKRLENLKQHFQSANLSKPDSKSFLLDKARELADSCRILVGIIEPRILKKYPELAVGQESQWFTMYGTVACVACACIRIGGDVPKEYRTEVELKARQGLEEWYEESLGFFEEAVEYIKEHILDVQDRKKRYYHIFQLASLWFVGKLMTIESISIEDKFANTIASEIAEIFRNETAGYWRTENE